MTHGDGARAWSTYWSQHGTSCCLPSAPLEVTRALGQFWTSACAEFGGGGTILDLGCGAGALAYLIARTIPAAQLVGVDFSKVPPGRSARVRLLSDVRMESLPFADEAFDGALSQFGIEYAEEPEAAAELARVTKSGAPVAFVIHHAASPVLAHNRRRDGALGALTAADIASAFLEGDRQALASVLARARNSYPDQDVVQEFIDGLTAAIGQSAEQRRRIWTETCAKVTDERAILAALGGAAVADIEAWLADFRRWFSFGPPGEIAGERGAKFAWAVKGRRL